MAVWVYQPRKQDGVSKIDHRAIGSATADGDDAAASNTDPASVKSGPVHRQHDPRAECQRCFS